MNEPDLQYLMSATPGQLREEYRGILATRAPLLRMRVHGALTGLVMAANVDGGPPNIGAEWALRAHLGTIDKLESLFDQDRDYRAEELLATARNLFENLVWLKLFSHDLDWGTRFYGQFLKQHEEDLQRTIAKMEAEAALFDEADDEEDADMDLAFTGLEADDDVDQRVESALELRERQRVALDMKIRRTFSLFAASARFNGYGLQAHLIRTEHLPRHQAQLDLIRAQMSEFERRVGDPQRVRAAFAWMKWKEAARTVDMLEQYDFLYAYTSRLLHATPMNIITEKQLTPGEDTMLMEYVVVTAIDLLDAMDVFTFPGRVEMLAIHVAEGD